MHTRFPGPRAIAAAAIAGPLFGAVVAAPAAAITRGGTLDGDDHPMVGLLTVHAEGGEYLWRCSGTLISPTVFITAGHCTEPDDSQGFGLPAYGLIYFSDELIVPDPEFTLTTRSCDGIEGYPCGDAGGDLVTRTGSLYLHPEYDPNAFYTHDLGVVVLDQPLNLAEYGQLPELNSLDELKLGARFDSVGFGLQRAHGPGASWRDIANRVRMVAHPYLIQLNIGRPLIRDFAMLLSNNPTTGGTCFGDSGGPNFLAGTLILAAVTSFGTNWACGGTGGVYRLDRADDLEWLESEFGDLF
jgi:Trypsin